MFGLLGGSSSTTKVTSTVNVITNVVMQNIQSCPVVVNNNQAITVGDYASGVKISGNQMTINARVDATCVQNVTQSSKIINDIAQNLSNHISATTSGLSLGVEAKTKLNEQLYTDIMTSIDMSAIQDCTTSLTQDQKITVGTHASDVEISNNIMIQTADIVRNCMANSIMSNQTAASAINYLDNVNKSTNTNPISDVVSSVGSVVSQYMIVIFIFILIIAYLFKDTISAVIFGVAEQQGVKPATSQTTV